MGKRKAKNNKDSVHIFCLVFDLVESLCSSIGWEMNAAGISIYLSKPISHRALQEHSQKLPHPFFCFIKKKSETLSRVQLFVTPMDCSPPGSSVHGILQARILELVAISSSRGSSHPGTEPRSPTLQADFLLTKPPGKSVFVLPPASDSPKWAL